MARLRSNASLPIDSYPFVSREASITVSKAPSECRAWLISTSSPVFVLATKRQPDSRERARQPRWYECQLRAQCDPAALAHSAYVFLLSTIELQPSERLFDCFLCVANS